MIYPRSEGSLVSSKSTPGPQTSGPSSGVTSAQHADPAGTLSNQMAQQVKVRNHKKSTADRRGPLSCFYSLIYIENQSKKIKKWLGFLKHTRKKHQQCEARSLLNTGLLPSLGAVGACTVSVVQPGYLEVDYTYKAVTIECTFSTMECPSEQPMSLWFRYGSHQAETLCLTGCGSEADKFTVRKALDQNQVSLTVNRVTSNDSAVYICGIAFPNAQTPRAKQTGGGTTMVVRG